MLDTDHQVIAFPLSDRIAQNRLAQLDDVVAITASMVGVAELVIGRRLPRYRTSVTRWFGRH